MILETDELRIEITSREMICEAINALNPESNNRAILSKSEENYIQTGVYSNGAIIEKRSGSEATHVHARHASSRPPLAAAQKAKGTWWQRFFSFDLTPGPHDHAFTLDEVRDIFVAYYEGESDPEYVTWHGGYA